MFINIKMPVYNTHIDHDTIHMFKHGVYNLTWKTPVELCLLLAQFRKNIFSNSTL